MASDPSGLFYSPGMSDFDMSNTYGSPDLTWQVNAQNNSIRIANQTYNSSFNVSVSSPTYTASANLASGGSRSNSGSSSGLVVRDYGTTRNSVYAGLKADMIEDINAVHQSYNTAANYSGGLLNEGSGWVGLRYPPVGIGMKAVGLGLLYTSTDNREQLTKNEVVGAAGSFGVGKFLRFASSSPVYSDATRGAIERVGGLYGEKTTQYGCGVLAKGYCNGE